MELSTSATAKRQRPEWRNRVDQASKPVVPSTPPPPPSEELSPMPPPSTVAANGHDDETFTVSGGKGKSPDVEPGVYLLVVTNVRRETGPNPFEPGTERTPPRHRGCRRGRRIPLVRRHVPQEQAADRRP